MSGSANECQRIIAQRRPPPSLLKERQLTAAVRPKAAIPLSTKGGSAVSRNKALQEQAYGIAAYDRIFEVSLHIRNATHTYHQLDLTGILAL